MSESSSSRGLSNNEVRFLRPEKRKRRRAFLGFVGATVVMGVWAYEFTLTQHDYLYLLGIPIAIFWAFPVNLLFWSHFWRFRVDGTGIAVRRALGWDMWPWHAFESGEVRLDHDLETYVWPGRPGPWWRRRLRFHACWIVFLGEEDAFALRRLCARIAPPMAEPELIDDFRIALPEPIEVDAGGIRYVKEDRRYRWEEVREIVLGASWHELNDYTWISVELPDGEFDFSAASARRRDPRAVIALIRRHVPEQRIVELAHFGPAKSQREIELRRKAELARIDYWTQGELQLCVPFLPPYRIRSTSLALAAACLGLLATLHCGLGFGTFTLAVGAVFSCIFGYFARADSLDAARRRLEELDRLTPGV